MLIALSPFRLVPATGTGLASRFKLVIAQPQRRWMDLKPHQKEKWRTLPWDHQVYLQLLRKHKAAIDSDKGDSLGWDRPLMPFVMRRGTIMYDMSLKHYVLLLNGVSISARLDDPIQEPVLTADAYMLTSKIKEAIPWRVHWAGLDTEPSVDPNEAPWDIHVRTEYDIRPKENPNLPVTKISRFFDKEFSLPIMGTGTLTIPIKHLADAVPKRWFSATEESMGRLDPFAVIGPRTRDLYAFCPTLLDADVGLIDAHHHGRKDISSSSAHWPFEKRTCLVFSHQGPTKEEGRRMLSAAEKLAQRFKELGRVRTATVNRVSLHDIIQKVLPDFEDGRKPNKKKLNLSRILIARALEKRRGTTVMIYISKDMPRLAFVQLLEAASKMQEDTAVILAVVGRAPYKHIFNHESELVRETFATEIIFRPPLKQALPLTPQEPEPTPEEDEKMRIIMERLLSHHEQRKIREREEAEKIRRKEEHEKRLAAIRKEAKRQREAEIQERIREEKRAERERQIAEEKKIQVKKDVDAWYEAAVQHEIAASLREQELESHATRKAGQDPDTFGSPDDTEMEIEEAQPSKGSIAIQDGDICMEKEGSITVMDGFLNKRDGSIVIKTGFVNMDNGSIAFLQRSDMTYFEEDLGTLSISFEDGVSSHASGPANNKRLGLVTDDEVGAHPDLMSLTDAVITITDGSIEIKKGSIKVVGEEGFDDAKKILSSIRIKRGAIHIVSGSATFKEGMKGFIKCSFDISETTLDFKDGFSDVKQVDDSHLYSVGNWGTGYRPMIDSNGPSYNSWGGYEPKIVHHDTARERVLKRQEAVLAAAKAEKEAQMKREQAEKQAQMRREQEEKEAQMKREQAEKKARMEREQAEEEERKRKEVIAQKRAALLAKLPVSFLSERKRKGK
ncbi:hypothetical protein QBC40DRAFT_216876 [Triangularia verruculosa]|uniref:Uncharacterized protein n=1 Tax=Triangularia verruculosa TaxID=2587418 RepID=A0AAN6XPS9_9PEZI|nr:hypothetical protein QBC40DRAFT_216876 [Triangularia verruculosa]